MIYWDKEPTATHYVVSFEPGIPSGFYRADGVKMRDVAREDEYTFRLDDVHPGRLLELIERPTQWSGKGMPPAGTVCEHKRVHEWQKVEVFAVKPNYNGSQTALFTYENGCWAGCAEPSLFRPIRTAEQIAADERIQKVRNALTAIKAGKNFPNESLVVATVEAMIDAGFVRQVAP